MAQAPILRVVELGGHGVNVVETPLHLSDQELTHAQNGELYREQGDLALRKRLGIAAFSSGMVGAVRALTTVPLVDPLPPGDPWAGPYLFHGDNGSGRFCTTPSGVVPNILESVGNASGATGPTVARLGNTLIYQDPDLSGFWSGDLVAYDIEGLSNSTFATVPTSGSAVLQAVLRINDSTLLVAYIEGTEGKVYTVTLGSATQLGATFNLGGAGVSEEVAWLSLAILGTDAVVAVYENIPPTNTVRLYTCPLSGGSWTLQTSFTDARGDAEPWLMAGDGVLWLGYAKTSGQNIVKKTTDLSTYTTVYTSSDSGSPVRRVVGAGDICYWYEQDLGGGSTSRIVGTVDGATTSTVLTFTSAVYQITAGFVQDDVAVFGYVEDEFTGPWTAYEIDNLVGSLLFTQVSGTSYVALGGIG